MKTGKKTTKAIENPVERTRKASKETQVSGEELIRDLDAQAEAKYSEAKRAQIAHDDEGAAALSAEVDALRARITELRKEK